MGRAWLYLAVAGRCSIARSDSAASCISLERENHQLRAVNCRLYPLIHMPLCESRTSVGARGCLLLLVDPQWAALHRVPSEYAQKASGGC